MFDRLHLDRYVLRSSYGVRLYYRCRRPSLELKKYKSALVRTEVGEADPVLNYKKYKYALVRTEVGVADPVLNYKKYKYALVRMEVGVADPV